MRKPRDYDAELKALTDKARQLKSRKQSQLGELVMAAGADALNAEELAGALLAIATTTDSARREAWRKRGAAFFSGKRDEAGHGAGDKPGGAAAGEDRAPPAAGQTGTRDWQVKRRERTRHLIELGGLVMKAGLVELVDDDRAVILGLLGEAAARLRAEDRAQQLLLWRRRGQRMFAAESLPVQG